MSAGLHCYLETVKDSTSGLILPHSYYWQNLVLRDFKTEVSSLLADNQGLFQLLRTICILSLGAPFLQASNNVSNPPHALNLSNFFIHQQRKLSAFKNSCDYTEPTKITSLFYGQPAPDRVT